MKKLTALALAVLMLASVFAFSSCSTAEEDPGTLMDMKMTVLKIGQADCILIETGTHVIMVDTGEDEDSAEILQTLTERGIERIDKLIITHYDSDHVGGADKIIDAVEVGQVLQANYKKKSTEFQQYMTSCEKKNIIPHSVNLTYRFTVDGTEFAVIPALKSKYNIDKDNENSLMISIKHGEQSILLAGDAMTERMAEAVRAQIGQFNVLKVPNHGINCEGLSEFLAHVAPEYAIITCSAKNPADPAVETMITDGGAQLLETVDGNITVTCAVDGTITVKVG